MQNNSSIRMNALEFLNSWEKKWHELNKLDYFIYQVINLIIENLGNNAKNQSVIDIEGMRSLAFLIGDKLENFLAEQCFSRCPLNCPLSPDKISDIKILQNKTNQLKRLEIDFPLLKKKNYQSNFWQKEIKRYVVQAVVIDFFRFNDNDFVLNSNSDIRKIIRLVSKVIREYSYSPVGNSLLIERDLTADFEFAEALKLEDDEKFGKVDIQDSNQMDFLLNDAAEDGDEIEELEDWQIPPFKMSDTIENYLLDFSQWKSFPGNAHLKEKRDHLLLFSNFLEDFSFITNIAEVDISLLNEYFYFYLPLYLDFSDYDQLGNVHRTLLNFFHWMVKKNFTIKKNVLQSIRKLTPYIDRLVQVNKAFHNSNILEIIEGQDKLTTYQNFYQVISRNQRSLIVKNANIPFFVEVELPSNCGLFFRKDDILDMVIAKNNQRHFSIWHLAHIYPGKAQMFVWGNAESDPDSD